MEERYTGRKKRVEGSYEMVKLMIDINCWWKVGDDKVEIGKERSFYRKKGFLKELDYSKEDRVGSEIVLWRNVYAGFGVRTMGRFPQRTEGWLWQNFISPLFWVWLLCLSSVLVSRTSDAFFILRCFFLFLSQSIVFKPLRGGWKLWRTRERAGARRMRW